MSWVNKSTPWWFNISQHMGWQARWLGTHNRQLLSGICAKKSFIKCYTGILEQKIERITFVPDNKLFRIWYGITQHKALGDYFFTHLPDLLQTNPCIVTAIKQIISTQTQPEFCAVLMQLMQAITTGKTLSQAIETHPDYFTALDIHCVRLGEAHGDIMPVLATIVRHRTIQRHLQRTISNSCRYPLFLLGFSLLTMGFFLVQIIPQFSQVLSQVGISIPPHTQHLIAVSQWLSAHQVMIVCSLGAGIFAYYLLPYTQSHRKYHAIYNWMPPALKQLEWQFRFCHTLAMLINSHMELTQSIRCLITLCHHKQEKQQLTMLCAAIHHGMGFSTACSHTNILPTALIQQLAVAERSHTLALTLHSIATQVEQQGKTQLGRYTDLLAPGIMLAVGILIGCMLYCLYLPMLEAPLSL